MMGMKRIITNITPRKLFASGGLFSDLVDWTVFQSIRTVLDSIPTVFRLNRTVFAPIQIVYPINWEKYVYKLKKALSTESTSLYPV